MRFLTIFRPATSSGAAAPSAGGGDRMQGYADEQMQAGVLLSQAMLDPAVVEVRYDGQAYDVSRTPDPVAGYAFIEAASEEAALQNVREFMQAAGPGKTEIRRVLS